MNTQADALILDIKWSDPEAVRGLVEAFWDEVCRYAMYLGASSTDAEDIAQEAFVKAFRSAGSFVQGTNFRAWILRITGNCFVDWVRRKAARKEVLSNSALSEAASQRGPEAGAESRELQLAVAGALKQLSDKERAVFALKIYERMPHREIAEALGTSEGAVRWHLCQARRKMRELLADYL